MVLHTRVYRLHRLILRVTDTRLKTCVIYVIHMK